MLINKKGVDALKHLRESYASIKLKSGETNVYWLLDVEGERQYIIGYVPYGSAYKEIIRCETLAKVITEYNTILRVMNTLDSITPEQVEATQETTQEEANTQEETQEVNTKPEA